MPLHLLMFTNLIRSTMMPLHRLMFTYLKWIATDIGSSGIIVASTLACQLSGHIFKFFSCWCFYWPDLPEWPSLKWVPGHFLKCKGNQCDYDHITHWVPIYLKIWGKHHIPNTSCGTKRRCFLYLLTSLWWNSHCKYFSPFSHLGLV